MPSQCKHWAFFQDFSEPGDTAQFESGGGVFQNCFPVHIQVSQSFGASQETS